MIAYYVIKVKINILSIKYEIYIGIYEIKKYAVGMLAFGLKMLC